MKPTLNKGLDQDILNRRVWPHIRDVAAIFDSYNCRNVKKYGHARPWPTRRQGYRYVGYGPTKEGPMKTLSRKECPVECRPQDHQDWLYC